MIKKKNIKKGIEIVMMMIMIIIVIVNNINININIKNIRKKKNIKNINQIKKSEINFYFKFYINKYWRYLIIIDIIYKKLIN